MDQYLYGANVNQIQSFIFETSRLKEIVGASELVEQICTSKFQELLGSAFQKERLLLGAAGRITYLFDGNSPALQKVLLEFQQNILHEIPSIQLCQAVVKLQGPLRQEDLQLLEERLNIQRNKPRLVQGLGLMIAERSRRTGGPATVDHDPFTKKQEWLDRAQLIKRTYYAQEKNSVFDKLIDPKLGVSKKAYAEEMEQLLPSVDQSWIAIVHADGNNMGKIINEALLSIEKNGDPVDQFISTFSRQIDEACKAAARDAFEEAVLPVYKSECTRKAKAFLPIRPVILSGDDLSVIIRGDLALHFTEVFLRGFEHHTKIKLGQLGAEYKIPALQEGLSACAGIAFIKSKYPFHYGVDLAETLCEEAKKRSKALPETSKTPSSLMFHRVLSAFVDSEFEDLAKRELSTKAKDEDKDEAKVGFDFGPYFLHPQSGNYATIKELHRWINTIAEDDAPRAPLREWLSVLDFDPDKAKQLLDRICKINKRYEKSLALDRAEVLRNGKLKTHLYDVISMYSIEQN